MIPQTRPLGAPITLSQRQQYRETPDSDFYANYRAAFAASQSAKAPADETASPTTPAANAPANLEDILGVAHTSLSAMRGVSEASQRTYAAVLDRAYANGGLAHAREFLMSLSGEALEAVRCNHCLAAPINPATISEEGARNLLLPEGYAVDLDADGIHEVGLAKTASFPPANAPAEFREAWFQASAGIDDGMRMSYALVMHGSIYGMQIEGMPKSAPLPDNQLGTYRDVVDRYLISLDISKPWLAEGQYERDKAFFTRLQALLSA